MKKLLLLLALAFATPATAQITWPCGELPCLKDPFWNSMAHDAGHAALAVGVAEGLRIFDSDWNRTDRYIIGTVALPLLQETVDWLAFHAFKGEPEVLPSRGSFRDVFSYQGAWIVPLIKEKKYWQAALVTIVWSGSIYLWNSDKHR